MSGEQAVTFSLARVQIDPNSFARRDPTLSVASFDDADRTVGIGETVWAVQADDDGFEGLAFGRVANMDLEHRLLFVDVDWSSFHERLSDVSALFGRGSSFTTKSNASVFHLVETVWGHNVQLADGCWVQRQAGYLGDFQPLGSNTRPRALVKA